MRTVYKYPIDIKGKELLEPIEIKLPMSAKVIAFRATDDRRHGMKPYIWAEIYTEHSDESRVFVVYGTGMEIDRRDRHVATCFSDEPYVWHLYERI